MKEEKGRAVDWDETLEGYRQRQEPRRSTLYTALLIVRAMHVLTPMMMMVMVVSGLL